MPTLTFVDVKSRLNMRKYRTACIPTMPESLNEGLAVRMSAGDVFREAFSAMLTPRKPTLRRGWRPNSS